MKSQIRIPAVLATSFAVAVVAAGCGSSSSGSGAKATVNPNAPEVNAAGDIPDNQAYVAYTPPGGGYSVKVPEGWARTASGGAVTFTDKLNSVRMESMPAARPDSASAAQQRTVPALEKSVSGFKLGKVSTVSRQAGKATLITFLETSKPDTVTGKAITDAVERYSFFHGGKRIVLTLTGPKGADNVDPWRIVTDSLRFTG